jgi:integrase
LPGFVLRIGRREMTYAIQRELWVGTRGARRLERTVRQAIGPARGPFAISLEEARNAALRALADVRQGVDPRAERTPERVWTVREAYAEYARERPGQERTTGDMQDRARRFLSDWLERPITSITALEWRARYQAIQDGVRARAARAGATGARSANQTLGDFRSVWRLAAQVFGLRDDQSPTRGVGKRAKERPRHAVISPEGLAAWWDHVRTLPRADLHLLGLLSGLRPGSLVRIERAWIDLDARVIAFPASSMKARRPFDLPLSAPMIAVIKRCLLRAEVLYPGSEYLFPARSRDGRRTIHIRNWTEDARADGTPTVTGHGLRHSYSNVAETIGIPSSQRQLMFAQRVAGVEGRYLDNGALWSTLQAAQERISARIVELTGAG